MAAKYENNKIVAAIVEQLSTGGPDDGERKKFYELGRTDRVSFHLEGGSVTPATSGGHLPFCLEPLPPPPYVARDALGSYSVMSPGAASFIQPNVVPAGNMQEMNAYSIPHHHQQQHQQQLSTSTFNASAHSLYGSVDTQLGAEPPPSLLSAFATYSDTTAPSIRNVSNGYLYPPGTDSRFSSQL